MKLTLDNRSGSVRLTFNLTGTQDQANLREFIGQLDRMLPYDEIGNAPYEISLLLPGKAQTGVIS